MRIWQISVVLLLIPRAGAAQGDPVGPEFRINTYTTSYQRSPAVASDSSGNFVVVWESYQDSFPTTDVFGQRYASNGAPLGPEFRINSSTTSFQRWQAVASEPSGNFVVVWNSYGQDGFGWGVFGQRYASNGVPVGPEFRVNTHTTNAQLVPAVASDFSGNFVVVWYSQYQPGSFFGVFGQRYASDGAPLGAEFRVNTYTTSDQLRPAIASDSSGNFVVVWQGWEDSTYQVFGRRFGSSGAPLGPEFRVSSTAGGFPSVAADPAGNLVVAWTLQGIYGRRYASNGAPLGPEFRVNTVTTSFQSDAAVVSDSSGNFVVVWTSEPQDGSFHGVFGQRYASDGAPLGPEFRVNTYTPGIQFRPAAASDASGNFVVVWESIFQDGSNSGIFGQRYNMMVPVELLHFRGE